MAEHIGTAREAIHVSVPLPYSPEQYYLEADTMRDEFPELVWQREGKPDKVSLGRRVRPEDWARYATFCPKIMETAMRVIQGMPDQDVEVSFGDVLDYRPGHLLGWHQDSMALTRHTFTAVLTLAAEGQGAFEWRKIADDGLSLDETVASAQPRPGDLVFHGLACNNALAHRAFWDSGRRVTLVLFCRSEKMEAVLNANGLDSNITMKNWWSKEFELTK